MNPIGTANRQLFMEDYRKLVDPAINEFSADERDRKRYVVFHESKAVAYYFPKRREIVVLEKADQNNPIVAWLMINSLVTDEDQRKLLDGEEISWIDIPTPFMQLMRSQDDTALVYYLYKHPDPISDELTDIVENTKDVVGWGISVKYHTGKSQKDLIKLIEKLDPARYYKTGGNMKTGGYITQRHKIPTDQETIEKVKALLGTEDYKTFVKKLGKLSNDKRVMTLLGSGLFDGSRKDESFKMEIKEIPVKNLRPTQNEIDMDKSLTVPLKAVFPSSLEDVIGGKNVEIVAPIVVLNDKYILDGHHRWSQVYSMNKDATMKALVFTGNIKPLDMLKVLQVAIANEIQEVPTKNVRGTNLFKVKDSQVKKEVLEKISPMTLQIMKEHNKIQKGTKEEAVKYVLDNIHAMQRTSKPVPNAPSRNFMPQTDEAKYSLEQTRKGKVNFRAPLMKMNRGGSVPTTWYNRVISGKLDAERKSRASFMNDDYQTDPQLLYIKNIIDGARQKEDLGKHEWNPAQHNVPAEKYGEIGEYEVWWFPTGNRFMVSPISKKKTGGSVPKADRPFKVRFHLGRGKDYMKWRLEDTDDKEVFFLPPEEVQLVMTNCVLTNRPARAKKIFSGEINKEPIAFVKCADVDIKTEIKPIKQADKLSYNPRKSPNWENSAGDNVDGIHFDKLMTYGRSVFAEKDGKFFELGGLVELNSLETLSRMDKPAYNFNTGGKISNKQHYKAIKEKLAKIGASNWIPHMGLYKEMIVFNLPSVPYEVGITYAEFNEVKDFSEFTDTVGQVSRFDTGGTIRDQAQKKFIYVMREFGKGRLKHGTTGKKVTEQDMAVAIAYSEAREIDPTFGKDKKQTGGKIGGTIFTWDNEHGGTTRVLIKDLGKGKHYVQLTERRYSEKYKKPIFHEQRELRIDDEELKKLHKKLKTKKPRVKRF
jgi:hypothetical protein